MTADLTPAPSHTCHRWAVASAEREHLRACVECLGCATCGAVVLARDLRPGLRYVPDAGRPSRAATITARPRTEHGVTTVAVRLDGDGADTTAQHVHTARLVLLDGSTP